MKWARGGDGSSGNMVTGHGGPREGLGALLVADKGLAEARHAGARHGGGRDVGQDAAVLELVVAALVLDAGDVGEGGAYTKG